MARKYYIALFISIIFSIIGFLFANHHNQYDEYIEKAQQDIWKKKNDGQNSSDIQQQ